MRAPRPRLARVPLFVLRTAGPLGGPACENPGEKSGSRQQSRLKTPAPRDHTARRRLMPLFAPRGRPSPHVVAVSRPMLTMPCRGAAPLEHAERYPSRLIAEPTSWLCIVPRGRLVLEKHSGNYRTMAAPARALALLAMLAPFFGRGTAAAQAVVVAAPPPRRQLQAWRPVCAAVVVVPEGVTEIPYMAFSSCIALTSITLPESLESVGYWAFSG